jgi:hypothetical protein
MQPHAVSERRPDEIHRRWHDEQPGVGPTDAPAREDVTTFDGSDQFWPRETTAVREERQRGHLSAKSLGRHMGRGRVPSRGLDDDRRTCSKQVDLHDPAARCCVAR